MTAYAFVERAKAYHAVRALCRVRAVPRLLCVAHTRAIGAGARRYAAGHTGGADPSRQPGDLRGAAHARRAGRHG